jgi:hypothetical protein
MDSNEDCSELNRYIGLKYLHMYEVVKKELFVVQITKTDETAYTTFTKIG